MKTEGRRKSKNVIVLKTEKDKEDYSRKSKMFNEQMYNKNIRSKTPLKNQKSPETQTKNTMRNVVKARHPKAALEGALDLKNRPKSKPSRFEKKKKDK